jgi:hypothetical protein
MTAYDIHADVSEVRLIGAEVLGTLRAAVRSASHALLLMLALVAMSAPFAVHPAAAAQVCGDRTVILQNLALRFSEKPRAMGLSSQGKLIEVLVSSSGSWTILISSPNRRTCLAAAGEHWEMLKERSIDPLHKLAQ